MSDDPTGWHILTRPAPALLVCAALVLSPYLGPFEDLQANVTPAGAEASVIANATAAIPLERDGPDQVQPDGIPDCYLDVTWTGNGANGAEYVTDFSPVSSGRQPAVSALSGSGRTFGYTVRISDGAGGSLMNGLRDPPPMGAYRVHEIHAVFDAADHEAVTQWYEFDSRRHGPATFAIRPAQGMGGNLPTSVSYVEGSLTATLTVRSFSKRPFDEWANMPQTIQLTVDFRYRHHSVYGIVCP